MDLRDGDAASEFTVTGSFLLTFGIVNGLFFTGVFLSVLYFHPAVRKIFSSPR
jgi:hypothetical protein